MRATVKMAREKEEEREQARDRMLREEMAKRKRRLEAEQAMTLSELQQRFLKDFGEALCLIAAQQSLTYLNEAAFLPCISCYQWQQMARKKLHSDRSVVSRSNILNRIHILTLPSLRLFLQ